jgi:hypothetical protein
VKPGAAPPDSILDIGVVPGGQIAGEVTMLDAAPSGASGAINAQTDRRAPEPSSLGDVDAYVAPAIGDAVAPASRS